MIYEDLVGRIQAYYIRVSGAGIWGSVTGNIDDQDDLNTKFSGYVPTFTQLTINGQTYDLSTDRSWTISGATWGSITGTLSAQTDLQSALDAKVPTTRTLTINGTPYDLSTDRSWTISGATWGSITGTLSAQTDLQSALDAKVPTTRTLTINGTAYDLSADRSWTIATGIAIGDTVTGGTAGNILFLGTSNVLAQDSVFKFDASTKRVGIGTSTLNYAFNLETSGNTQVYIKGGIGGAAGLIFDAGYGIFEVLNGAFYTDMVGGGSWQIRNASYANVVHFNTTDRKMGLGGNATSETMLSIKTISATDRGLIIQGITAQSGNLYENRLVGGTVGISGWDANGNLFVGANTPTAYADIAASTVTRASLRLRVGTLPTVPNAGDMVYDGAFKGWNGSSWLTFGGGGISIGDTITGANPNSILFYNGGLAQGGGFTYTVGTTTLAAENTIFASIQAKSAGDLNIKDYTGAVRLIVGVNGTYFLGVGQIATNTAFGNGALRYTTAANNTAFGYQTLSSVSLTGQYNTAIGTNALQLNTTGYSNNAFGRLALNANTTGFNNMAMGHTALYSNTSGVGNIGVGTDALRKNTTAHYNVAIGAAAMYGGTSPSGAFNIAVGYSALENYTSGQWNIAIGTTAGGGITSGSYNTLIGKLAGLSPTLSNTIILADGQGNKGFEWATPIFKIYGDTLNISTAKTPASAAAAGTAGDIVWDTDFIYVCTATNTWKKTAIATW
jgi:predicted heme/steroid binding protein